MSQIVRAAPATMSGNPETALPDDLHGTLPPLASTNTPEQRHTRLLTCHFKMATAR
ncbi:hypothetical protein [Streptomyces mirabilis]|uniref:hypothetical protein n=1 Tax=Streptomyces mirabilis TaxID=68239 RepID=UPI0036ACAA5B